MKTLIKFLIACVLIGCIFSMPCIYFDFVLISGCATFCWLAVSEYKKGNTFIAVACAVAAVLYNPIFRVNFTRIIWNDIDMFLATLLLLWTTIDIFIKPSGKFEYKF